MDNTIKIYFLRLTKGDFKDMFYSKSFLIIKQHPAHAFMGAVFEFYETICDFARSVVHAYNHVKKNVSMCRCSMLT